MYIYTFVLFSMFILNYKNIIKENRNIKFWKKKKKFKHAKYLKFQNLQFFTFFCFIKKSKKILFANKKNDILYLNPVNWVESERVFDINFLS